MMKEVKMVLFTACVLVFGLLFGQSVFFAAQTVHVATEEELSEAVANATEQTTILLDSDLVLTAPIVLTAQHDVTVTSADDTAATLFADTARHFTLGANARLTLRHIVLDGGLGDGFQSGIYNEGGFVTVAEGAVITNCSAYFGGAIYSKNGQVTVSGGTLAGNGADSYGGGIYASGGAVIVGGGEVRSNTAGISGGGIYLEDAVLTITGGTLDGNTAQSGGGVYGSDSQAALSGGAVTGNTAQSGGGFFQDGGVLTVGGGAITDNTAGFSGGAVYGYDTQITITGGTLERNAAAYFGGAVYSHFGRNATGTTDLQNAVFSDNTADSGGAVWTDNLAKLTVVGCFFGGNKAGRAYWMIDEADIALYAAQCKDTNGFSAAPDGYPAFAFAYNNYDIGYEAGTDDPMNLVYSAGFDGAVTARIDNVAYEGTQAGMTIAAVYNDEGVLVTSEAVPFTVTSDTRVYRHTFGINPSDYPADQFQIHVFFWDRFGAPLTTAIARATD